VDRKPHGPFHPVVPIVSPHGVQTKTVTVTQTRQVDPTADPLLFGVDPSHVGSHCSGKPFRRHHRGHLVNRYYDPSTEQFISVDPLVSQTGQPFSYAGDDPVNESDPSGADDDPSSPASGPSGAPDSLSQQQIVADTGQLEHGGVKALADDALQDLNQQCIEQLSESQQRSYYRYLARLPKGANTPTINQLQGGGAVFSSEVPGRVPGSYASYVKQVDADGVTVSYKKVTIDPLGSLVHVKDKLNP